MIRAPLAAAAVVALLALAAAPQPAAPDIQVETALTPEPAEVGLVMQLELVIRGEQAADCALVELPETEGAHLRFISGPETFSRTLRVNGRRTHSITSTWRVEVVPERDGVVVIPPIRFECRGSTVFSDELRFDVKPSRVPDDAIDIELRADTNEVYVGEVVELRLVASVDEEYYDLKLARGGLQLDVPWLDELRSFHRRPSRVAGASGTLDVLPSGVKLPFRVDRQQVNGRAHIVLETSVPLLATEPGAHELDASRLGVRVAVEAREERDIFRGRRLVATKVLEASAESEPLTLTVKPTPLEGRPADFVDAVGRFSLAGSVQPRELAVGESLRLQLVLTPADGVRAGNLELLSWPPFEDQLGDFRVFGKETANQEGRRVIVYELSPRHANVTEVPELSVVSFDPAEGRYVRASTGPFPLEVEGGGGEQLASLSSRADRLRDLDTIRVELPAPAPSLPWWWGAPLLAALLLLGIDVTRRRRAWRASHGGELRRRGAGRALEEELRAADDASQVAAAFARFAAARLGGPEAGLTREEARRALADRGRAELAAELDRVLEGWELAYLGGGRLDVDTARDQARALARRLEAAT